MRDLSNSHTAPTAYAYVCNLASSLAAKAAQEAIAPTSASDIKDGHPGLGGAWLDAGAAADLAAAYEDISRYCAGKVASFKQHSPPPMYGHTSAEATSRAAARAKRSAEIADRAAEIPDQREPR